MSGATVAGVLAAACLVLVAPVLAGCTAAQPSPTTPTPTSASPTPSGSSTFPTTITGLEFDRSLRNGAALGRSSFPPLGRLLASTQTGGPTVVPVDLTGVGRIIGIVACSSTAGGVSVRVERGTRSLLGFHGEGCDPTLLSSGESEPVGSGTGEVRMTVTAPQGVRFTMVLEEVQATS